MRRINSLFGQVTVIYREGGIFRLFSAALSLIFMHRIFYIYEHDLHDISGKKEKDLLPQVPDFSFKIITEIEEVEELERKGFDIMTQAHELRRSLKNRAVAFCLFHGTKLVHIGWIAMNAQAKDSITNVPYKVDFSKMGSIEVAITIPEYKGKNASRYFQSYKGFMPYSYFKRAQYLKERGIFIARTAIEEYSKAPRWAVERYNTRVISKVHRTRILGFNIWKEIPV